MYKNSEGDSVGFGERFFKEFPKMMKTKMLQMADLGSSTVISMEIQRRCRLKRSRIYEFR